MQADAIVPFMMPVMNFIIILVGLGATYATLRAGVKEAIDKSADAKETANKGVAEAKETAVRCATENAQKATEALNGMHKAISREMEEHKVELRDLTKRTGENEGVVREIRTELRNLHQTTQALNQTLQGVQQVISDLGKQQAEMRAENKHRNGAQS